MSTKTNPAPAFGSAERRRAFKGVKKVSGKSGARATKRRERKAKQAKQSHAEKTFQRLALKQAKGEKLTKAQAAALARHEPAAMRAEGFTGTDAEVMAEVQRLQKEHAKEAEAYRRAVSKILGPTGTAAAVKIARADGLPITRDEAEGLKAAGWAIYGAGTIAAQVGKTLAGYPVATNPTEGVEAALGGKPEARAVVIAAAGISEDMLHRLRGAGYDLSPAPKALREAQPAKHNPAPGKLSRNAALGYLRMAGYHGDRAAFVRIYAENRISRAAADEAYAEGAEWKARGAACSCYECSRAKTNPTAEAPKLQKAVYDLLKRGVRFVPDLAAKAKAPEESVEAALGRLAGMGLARPGAASLMFGPEWFPGADQPALFNPKRQSLALVSTGAKSGADAGNMTKKNPTRRAAAAAPNMGADLARVWEAWTGGKPGQVIQITLGQGANDHGIPSRVVILGRVSRLIERSGKVLDFGPDSGPLMVTDAKAKGVWLLSNAAHRFSLKPSVIAYIAHKPKFGDKRPTEYVHGFNEPAAAVMDGQAGRLVGSFTVTPRGLEG